MWLMKQIHWNFGPSEERIIQLRNTEETCTSNAQGKMAFIPSHAREELMPQNFCDCFNNCVDMVEHCGSALGEYNGVENELTALSLTFCTAINDQILQANRLQSTSCLDCPILCVLTILSLENC